jgi:hypothetical protein
MSLKRNESTDRKWTSPGEPIFFDPFGDPSVVFELFRPHTLRITEGGESTPVNDKCDFINRNPGQQLFRPRSVGHLLSIRESYQLMLDEENASGYKYDWVIHARPDIAIVRPLPSWTEWGNKSEKLAWYPWSEGLRGSGYSGVSIGPSYVGPSSCFEGVPIDHFNVFSRSSADSFFLIYDKYLKCTGSGILYGLNDELCCGGGASSAFHDTMTRSFGQIWAPFQFPVALMRPRWVRPNLCSIGKLSDDGYQPDVFQRCAAHPLPGCPCDFPDACPAGKTCSTDLLGAVICT